MDWETVIGLEVHVQLLTKSKVFSGASTAFGALPNHQACEVDVALPGVLPVMNRTAALMAVRFGLAIGATVNHSQSLREKITFILTCLKVIKLANMRCLLCLAGA